MVIRVQDIVAQCHTYDDGLVLQQALLEQLHGNEVVVVSFEGVHGVPSSFVNAAFGGLLRHYSPEQIRNRMRIVRSTRTTNAMIRERISAAEAREVA